MHQIRKKLNKIQRNGEQLKVGAVHLSGANFFVGHRKGITFCLTVAKKIVRGHFCVTENFWNRKKIFTILRGKFSGLARVCYIL